MEPQLAGPFRDGQWMNLISDHKIQKVKASVWLSPSFRAHTTLTTSSYVRTRLFG